MIHHRLRGLQKGASDPFWSDTVLLLRLDNDFVDAKGRHSFSAQGTTPTFTSGLFSKQCGNFAGNGSVRCTDNLSDFQFGTGDFTIEAWFRLTTSNTNFKDIITIFGNGNKALGTDSSDNAIHAWNMPDTLTSNITGAVSLNTWYHIAACRSSGTTRLFLDGSLADSAADSTNQGLPTHVEIGGWNANEYWIGQIQEVRVTRAARYTASFTAPSQPFPGQ